MGKVAHLVAVASLIASAGCGADAVAPTPLPTASAELIGSRPECEIDPVVFPEFDGQVMHPALLHDGSGLVTGCRHVGMDEQAVILETFGPSLPSAMARGATHVARADVEGTRRSPSRTWLSHTPTVRRASRGKQPSREDGLARGVSFSLAAGR